MITIIVHLANSEPVKLDVEEMPQASDAVIIGTNPRERSDKELVWIDEGVTTVIFPWHRVNYVQVLPDPNAEAEFDELYRDDH